MLNNPRKLTLAELSEAAASGAITAELQVTKPAETGIAETLAKFTVSDDANNYFAISNGTSGNATFQPIFLGYNNAITPGLQFVAGVGTDSGTIAVLVFQARLGGSSGNVLSTRPLMDFNNYSTNVMRILANGNIGIGTTSPVCKLDVNGPIRPASYTVATVPSAALGAGMIVYVTDDVGGAILAFSDGTNWRRVTDRAVISTT